MAQATKVRRIEIRWDSKGEAHAKKTAQRLQTIDKSAKQTAGSLGFMRNAFVGFLSVQGISTLARWSDSLQLLRDRISVFTGSVGSANETMKDLQQVAAYTKSSIAGLAESYNRIALSTKDLGLSNEAVLGTTLALQQTFRLSGSTLAEATASTIQLSQGLAAGALRGQELRSVLEANALFGGLLAKEFNVTRGELIKLGETGTITADRVLRVLAENFDDLNKQAGKLSLTFEQAATISLDKFKMQIFEINEKLGISKGLAGAMQTLAINTKTTMSVVMALATLAIPALTMAIGRLLLMLKSNAIIVAISLLTFAILEFTTNTEHTMKRAAVAVAYVQLQFAKVANWMSSTFPITTALLVDMGDSFVYVATGVKVAFNAIKDFILGSPFSEWANGVVESMDKAWYAMTPLERVTYALASGFLFLKNAISQVPQFLSDLADAFIYWMDKFLNFAATLPIVGNQFKTLIAYFKKLSNTKIKIDTDPLEGALSKTTKELNAFEKAKKDALGKLNLGKLKDAMQNIDMSNVSKKMKTLARINGEINLGLIDMKSYMEQLETSQVDDIHNKFNTGKITIQQYNAELVKMGDKFRPGSALYVGMNAYVEGVGSLSQNVAGAITKTFDHLEDTIVEFVKTGKFAFKDFANSVLEDLNRIIIRSLIIKPITQGIIGGISGIAAGNGDAVTTQSYDQQYPGAGYDSYSATGNSFAGGKIQAFAQGGLVSSPTLFNYNGGKTGLMGEAGTEAIMPLQRTSSGDLGVKADMASNVTVNVINNSESQAEVQESRGSGGDRILDVIITQKVAEGFSSGKYDSTMKSRYGLGRKGT